MSHKCPGCWRTSILDNRIICHTCYMKLTRKQRVTVAQRLAGTIEAYFAAEKVLARLRVTP